MQLITTRPTENKTTEKKRTFIGVCACAEFKVMPSIGRHMSYERYDAVNFGVCIVHNFVCVTCVLCFPMCVRPCVRMCAQNLRARTA